MSDPMNDAEIRIGLARLDERQKAATERADRGEEATERALQLAVTKVEERRLADWVEIQRRVHELNGSHETALRQQGKFEAEYVRREVFDREKSSADEKFDRTRTEGESRLALIKEEIVLLKTFNANLTGRMWIGGAAVLVIAAAIAAVIPIVGR